VAHYIYGIVEPATKAPGERGIADAPLALVAGEEAAALVSEIDRDEVRLGREAILIHTRVLERAMARGTVLPMRFGVVMSGPEEIRTRLLDEHAAELRAQLAELRGKVEIRIRASYHEESLLREVVRENPEIASLRASLRDRPDDATYYGRIRLGELVAAAVEDRREHDAQAILDALASTALAVDETPPAHERVAVQASFLLDRARLTEFNKIVDEVANGYGGRVRFKYTGPLPPHSFVELAGSL
jgi:Gas vesicle synthesis protein GvpL/GvpF